MGLQAILNAIATQATADADRVISDAEAQRDALIRRADALFESRKKHMLDEVRTEVDQRRELESWECDKKHHAVSAAAFEEALSAVKEKAVVALLSEKQELQNALIDMYVSNIPAISNGAISVASAHEFAVKKSLKNRSDIAVSVSVDTAIQGGFYVRTDTYELDATWVSIVDRTVRNNRAEYMSALRT